METTRPLELCVVCDDPTGRAGRGEDSLYCSVCEEQAAHIPCGPFCAKCYNGHLLIIHQGVDPNY